MRALFIILILSLTSACGVKRNAAPGPTPSDQNSAGGDTGTGTSTSTSTDTGVNQASLLACSDEQSNTFKNIVMLSQKLSDATKDNADGSSSLSADNIEAAKKAAADVDSAIKDFQKANQGLVCEVTMDSDSKVKLEADKLADPKSDSEVAISVAASEAKIKVYDDAHPAAPASMGESVACTQDQSTAYNDLVTKVRALTTATSVDLSVEGNLAPARSAHGAAQASLEAFQQNNKGLVCLEKTWLGTFTIDVDKLSSQEEAMVGKPMFVAKGKIDQASAALPPGSE